MSDLEFPYGSAFPTDHISTRDLFDRLDAEFSRKTNYLIADVPASPVKTGANLEPSGTERSVSSSGFERKVMQVSPLPRSDVEGCSSRHLPVNFSDFLQTLRDRKTQSSDFIRTEFTPIATIPDDNVQRIPRSGSVEGARSLAVKRLKEAASKLQSAKRTKIEQSTVSEDSLKPGNYLLATFDLLVWADAQTGESHIGQIGCTLALADGETFEKWVRPKNMQNSPFNYVNQILFYERKSTAGSVAHPLRVLNVEELDASIGGILDFMERGCNKIRPSFDGIILLAYSEEILRLFLRPVLSSDSLRAKFERSVRGIGLLRDYLKANHSTKFGTDEESFQLINVIFKVLGKNFFGGSGEGSKRMMEVLRTLLTEPPTYRNFFEKFTHPVESTFFAQLRKMDLRATEEKLFSLKPLKKFIAYGLQDFEDKIVILSFNDKSNASKLLSKSQIFAKAFVRQMVSKSLTLEYLSETFLKEGEAGLESLLQNFSDSVLMNQSSAVVWQFATARRLVSTFFSEFGKLSFAEVRSQFENLVLPPRLVTMQTWKSFEPLINYMQKKFGPKTNKNHLEQDIRILIFLLFRLDLNHSKIVFMWKHGKHCFVQRLSEYFQGTLEGLHLKPSVFKPSTFAKCINDYLEQAHDATTIETRFPYGFWGRFRLMASAFVEHFQGEFTATVCKEEAEHLMNAFLFAGFDEKYLQKCVMVKSGTIDQNFFASLNLKPDRLISDEMILRFLVAYFSEKKSEVKKMKNLEYPWNKRNVLTPDDQLENCYKFLGELIPKSSDAEKCQIFHDCHSSLVGLMKFMAPRFVPLIDICGGQRDCIDSLASFVQSFLALSGLNFVTLKSLHKTNGLFREIHRAFDKYKEVIFPGLDSDNVAKMINDYFQKFSISRYSK